MRALPNADPGLRLVALTGYGQDKDQQRAARAGFDRHLVKPVSLELVRRTISELVG
jgi:CheY-like chemotaxis protein